MRSAIRACALLILIGTGIFWFSLNGTLGWTKTSVEVITKDPITEIEAVRYEDRLVPGVEVLFLGVAGAVILFAVTLIQIPKKKVSS
jgi:hypothetical protein